MIYRQKNKNKGYKKYVVVGALFVLLFFFGYIFKSFFQMIGAPVLNANSSLLSVGGNLTSYFKSKSELEKINKQLVSDNQDLKIQVLTEQNLQKENEALKSQINFISNKDKRLVTKVITKPPFSPFDTFVIDANDQIIIDKKVYYKNILIGKIIETYPKTAVVKLFSSSDQKTPVELLGNEYEAEGQGNLSFKIRIPKSITVEKETPVYSSETRSILGVVLAIDSPEASAFQDIYFKYPININNLDYVEVEI